MALYTRDARNQFLTIGGIDIQPSGDNEFVSFNRGAQNTVTKGVTSDIVQREITTEDTMTITVFPEDPARALLDGIFARDRVAGAQGQGVPELPVSYRNTDNGERIVAANAIPIQPAEVFGAKMTRTVSYSFRLIGRRDPQ